VSQNLGGDRRLLGTAEAAQYLGVPVRSLQANWRVWSLRPYKVGRSLKFRASDLEVYLSEHKAA
jgi:excisionase family DNA binding protein